MVCQAGSRVREFWADAWLRGIPVVVLSADNTTAHRIVRLEASGTRAYLSNPVGIAMETSDAPR